MGDVMAWPSRLVPVAVRQEKCERKRARQLGVSEKSEGIRHLFACGERQARGPAELDSLMSQAMRVAVEAHPLPADTLPIMDPIAVARNLWNTEAKSFEKLPCSGEYMRTAICAVESHDRCEREFRRLRKCFEDAGVFTA